MGVFVIGEIAATHDGSLDKAHRLIDLCADIGCDAAKTQWVSSPEALARRRHAPEYLPAYRLLAFPQAWLPELTEHCARRAMEFMATVYLLADIPVVAPYVSRWKLSSFEQDDEAMLDAMDAYGQPVYVSTGMVEDDEQIVWRAGSHEHVQLLHCVSAYPTPIDEINLGVLHSGLYVGLSDHTRHPLTGALAVAAGADVIEFHVRLHDTDPANADYSVARTPEEARVYIENVRLAGRLMGNGEKRVMPSEVAMLRYRARP